jgi:hypothetical protein
MLVQSKLVKMLKLFSNEKEISILNLRGLEAKARSDSPILYNINIGTFIKAKVSSLLLETGRQSV